MTMLVTFYLSNLEPRWLVPFAANGKYPTPIMRRILMPFDASPFESLKRFQYRACFQVFSLALRHLALRQSAYATGQ